MLSTATTRIQFPDRHERARLDPRDPWNARAGRRQPARGEPHVHFHRGPNGDPAPCFDEACMRPRLQL